ncbi:MAG: hypothetical protein ACPGSB_08525, partial [Opitutales bacterium]
GFEWQGKNVEFDARSYKKRGINRIPEPKLGCAHAMHARGLHTERMELFEAVEELNGELKENEKELNSLEKNKAELERLESTTLENVGCLKAEDIYFDSAWRKRYHLNLDETLNFVEKLTAKVPLFESLRDDMLSLKRRCNDNLDFRPTIEEVPIDCTLSDLFPLIGQALSDYGLRAKGRTRRLVKTLDIDRGLER